MFGHRKGAFTGADRDKPGLLETANGGTLFLDELTEMSLPLQAKLLRVFRTAWFAASEARRPMRSSTSGSSQPQRGSREGRGGRYLRKDLFYRLRVVPFTLPARERVENMPVL
jgi:transcriptional regulator with PAS, ATPase and Fis domain